MINMYNCDCIGFMNKCKDNQYDLAIVDPDYGIKRFEKGSLRFDKNNKYPNGLNLGGKPNKKYFQELFRVSKNQIIWGANNFTLPESEYFIIWDKQQTVKNFACAEYAYTNIKKPAQIFRYGIHKHNVITKIHPTQKPIALYKWLLQNYAKEGDKIIDTHGGSGSICIACDELGYDLDWMEKDQDYYNDACNRFKEYKQNIKTYNQIDDIIG